MVEQRRDGVEDTHIDAVGDEQEDVVAIREQPLNGVEEGTLLRGCLLGSRRWRGRLLLND